MNGQERHCTIEESIIQACKEVKEIREGRKPKRSIYELFDEMKSWDKEKDE